MQEGKIDSSGNLYIGNFPSGFSVTNTPTVNQGGAPWSVSQSGTWTVQPGNTANSTAWLVTGAGGTFPVTGTFWQATQPVSCTTANCKVDVFGNAGAAFDGATNAAPPANALLQGMVAATALPAATTATDTVAPMSDKFGRQVFIPITVRDLVKMASVQTTSATQANLLAAQGAGVFADLISLFITSESSTACTISLTDGTTTYKINVANSQGSGSVWAPPTPVPAASANTAWQVTGCASVTLDYNAQFALNK